MLFLGGCSGVPGDHDICGVHKLMPFILLGKKSCYSETCSVQTCYFWSGRTCFMLMSSRLQDKWNNSSVNKSSPNSQTVLYVFISTHGPYYSVLDQSIFLQTLKSKLFLCPDLSEDLIPVEICVCIHLSEMLCCDIKRTDCSLSSGF